MQRTVTQIPGWHIETWEQPSGADASQDAHLVWRDPAAPRLRVAVLDGVTPTRRCRTVAGVAGPMYAAAVTRIALQRSGRGLVESLRAANHHLHDRSLPRSRDQTQTCVTAADVFDDGRIELVRAGDCEAWARTSAGWTHLGTGTALRPSVEVAWERWQDSNRTCGRDERHDAEERYLGRPAAWTSTALGRFPQPVIRKFTFHDAHELVLASDGARLREDVLGELSAWLAGLRRWERRRAATRRAAEKVHDDVTVIRMISGRG
ncbi:hypothetical protein OM076_35690 [Solirubrobacter ginsenosidimutans]|uniref:Protein phosphatase 2C domain-containing protein n=1 Tax=Solirubrobacter ginsenosidimutans TaxID=490573 RepID=A0A9X3N273_9ACTN|nr:hypothetical protein [Solirubrobacter ginsenosidimutans]MDA0165665.1 hypothetical protein [Solirubrobacter ginsenosidimutans]